MKLPREVVLHNIAPHLSARDISSFSSVNSTIRKLLSPEIYSIEYWGKKIYDDLGEPIPDISPFSNENWIDIRQEQAEETVINKPLITRYNEKSKKNFGKGTDFCKLLLKLKEWSNPRKKTPAGGKELFKIYSIHYWGRRIYERYLCYDYADSRYLGSHDMEKIPRKHFDYVIGMTVALAEDERGATRKLRQSDVLYDHETDDQYRKALLRDYDPRKSIKGDLTFLLEKKVVSQIYELYSYFYDKEVTEDKDYHELIHSPLIKIFERDKEKYFSGIVDKPTMFNKGGYFNGGVIETFKNNWIAMKRDKGDFNLKDLMETDEDGDTDLGFLDVLTPNETIGLEKFTTEYMKSRAKKKRKSSRKKKRNSSRKKKRKYKGKRLRERIKVQ